METPNSRALIMRTLRKRTPNSWKDPYWAPGGMYIGLDPCPAAGEPKSRGQNSSDEAESFWLFEKLGVLFVGVLSIRALLAGVYFGVLIFGNFHLVPMR